MSRKFNKQFAGVAAMTDPVLGITLDWGTAIPTDATAGYATGCIFILTNGSAGINTYINVGTQTSCDFNLIVGVDLSGLVATAAELNRNNQTSTREILAGATITLSQASHDGKTIAMPAACAVTLPASTGSGSRFKLYQKINATAVTITATAADLYGNAWYLSDNAAAAVIGFAAAGSTIITFDGSTKGGVKGATVELEDVATNLWIVRVMTTATGTEVTCFS